ncbi:MAG TPA: zinc ribbon domain-containing protein [Longimicrobiales bacterium]|nr:zinc ribbon domain-containing protein [Longimicrobiales bacterium]
MPTYEYRCPRGHHFEVFQRISEKPEAACPQCGEPGLRQISGGAGFLFKGGGFYATDYRSADYKKQASSESGASPAPAKDAGPSSPPPSPSSSEA